MSITRAKSTKQALRKTHLRSAKPKNRPNDTLIKKYQAQIAKYEKEKAVIKSQAEGYQKDYDDINLFDDQFDIRRPPDISIAHVRHQRPHAKELAAGVSPVVSACWASSWISSLFQDQSAFRFYI